MIEFGSHNTKEMINMYRRDYWDWGVKCKNCDELISYEVYRAEFCSEECYTATLTQDKKVEHYAQKLKINSKKMIKEQKQNLRMTDIILNHVPTYQPPTESVVFKCQRIAPKKESDVWFLGRWQKDKAFVFGQVRLYKEPVGGIWLESLREFEEIAMRKEGAKFEIRDHLGNKVSYKDFLWYALTSEVNHVKQRTTKREIKEVCESVIGVHQSYKYSGGLKP